jgi:hypothetical protein
MKVLIPLFLYAVVSGLAGLIVCGLMLWRKQSMRAIGVAAAVFFGGPPATYLYLYIKEGLEQRQFDADVAYVKELCSKYGGDKIVRTVDNVEGVFQMRARNPNFHVETRDQFGMFDPWGQANGDSDGVSVRLYQTPEHGGYLYFEQQAAFGQPEGPPYTRTVVTWTGKRIADSQPLYPEKGWMQYGQEKLSVKTLRSRYGYITEDLSTPEMRKRWIAGGRVKVIDLATKEILAERTGYFKAFGLRVMVHWSPTDFRCPETDGLNGFLTSVLHPPAPTNPDQQTLDSLKE